MADGFKKLLKRSGAIIILWDFCFFFGNFVYQTDLLYVLNTNFTNYKKKFSVYKQIKILLIL